MSNQLHFLFQQAIQFIKGNNLAAAQLLLKQIIKNKPNHSEALRYLAYISAQYGDDGEALTLIDKAILADGRNGIAFSNRGNIQLSQGMISNAIESYIEAIRLCPNYAEAYSNLGNAYQEKMQYDMSIPCYEKAISIDPRNAEFYSNLGNAYQEKMQYDMSIPCYEKAISIDPRNAEFYSNLGLAFWMVNKIELARRSFLISIEIDSKYLNARYNLAQLNLHTFNFIEGWSGYDVRWFTKNQDKPRHLVTSKPTWDGHPKDGRLLIWSEQGIGDQILYASMLNDLKKYPQTKIVSVDKKLLSIFQRSFPSMEIISKDDVFPEDLYDEQIAIGSLGKYLRPNIYSFTGSIEAQYLVGGKATKGLSQLPDLKECIRCGISWKSNRAKLGFGKSIPLINFAPIMGIENINFINLQYGEVSEETLLVKNKYGIDIAITEDIDLFEDIDGLSGIIEACNIVVTTSNTTAHLAGALGKETLLLVPFGNCRFWYWHDIDGVSLWYPSIRVFKQEKPGDWSKPIQEVKAYLENRFGS